VAGQLLASGDKKRLIKELAAYLIETGRVRDLNQVVATIEEALASRGAVVATVTTARPLSPENKQAIVEQFTPTGAELYIREQIDPSVIGGFKIELPGSQFDGTVIHKLTTLKGIK
jgi:ATP synthase F1, delta subunit